MVAVDEIYVIDQNHTDLDLCDGFCCTYGQKSGEVDDRCSFSVARHRRPRLITVVRSLVLPPAAGLTTEHVDAHVQVSIKIVC